MKTIEFRVQQTYPTMCIVSLSGVLRDKDQVPEFEDFVIADVMSRKFIVHKGTGNAMPLDSDKGGPLLAIRERIEKRGGIEWYRKQLPFII